MWRVRGTDERMARADAAAPSVKRGLLRRSHEADRADRGRLLLFIVMTIVAAIIAITKLSREAFKEKWGVEP